MKQSDFTTIGREYYPGLKVNLHCLKDTDFFEPVGFEGRFRIIYIKEGHGIFENNGRSQVVTCPTVLCLNNTDNVCLHKADSIRMDIMYFDPITFARYVDYSSLDDWRNDLGGDAFFFRPFFDRTDSYIGAFSTNYVLGSRITQLITSADDELTLQNNQFWPCRSRSFFIELLLAVNSVYSGDMSCSKIFNEKISDEIMNIIDWAQIHYLDKVVLEDITKQFHTNKTTLNQKFKAVMGMTVIEYIFSLRMQIACSLLRRTYLSVSEIMERSGYRDDAHFLRSFKKYSGCTPTEYRNQFESA